MELLDNKLFGVIISLLFFQIGKWIFNKTKLPLCNPLLIATIGVVSFIHLTKIPMEYYSNGASIIEFFLYPATVLLIVPLYKQRENLVKYWKPIIIGGLIGSIVAMISVYLLGRILNIDNKVVLSLIPKSITTPFGKEASEMLNGITSITVFGIILTGIIGNMLAVALFKISKITHPVAKGVGIGVSSHAVGTSKAIEIGELEGAMSALSIVVAGIITIVILQIVIHLDLLIF